MQRWTITLHICGIASIIDRSEIGAIILQCKNLFVQSPNYKVQYVGRQTNGVAHSLAGVATSHARLISPLVFSQLS